MCKRKRNTCRCRSKIILLNSADDENLILFYFHAPQEVPHKLTNKQCFHTHQNRKWNRGTFNYDLYASVGRSDRSIYKKFSVYAHVCDKHETVSRSFNLGDTVRDRTRHYANHSFVTNYYIPKVFTTINQY